MNTLTLLVLVDALRHDYVAHMPRLAARAARGRVGALREDFGFVPRAAYFGGLGPSAFGFTNMYCRNPGRSPFSLARALPAGPVVETAGERYGLRAFLDADARGKVPPYAATYVSSAEIPLDLAAEFDLAERRAPWDRRVGYRSVFHDLDDAGVSYCTIAWPETNRLADHSDRALCADAAARIHPPCRFAFLHLQELDGIGHACGPESREVLAALARIDAELDALIETLSARVDRLDLIVFGDHGMVSVTGATDVGHALDRAGLVNGRGFVAFIDSTMARFWFDDARLRPRVMRALAGMPGRVLREDELTALDLAGCDPRNGELYFLADPGVLILPNFFQHHGQAVRGMHGYHPDCPDNQGFFFEQRATETGRLDAGVVGPTEIYAALRRSLRLAHDGAAARMTVAEITSTDSSARAARPYTQHPDPDAATTVDAHMREIVREVRRAVPSASAILLNGSFGRDEGGIVRDRDGRFRPVNDYDVLVIAPGGPASQSESLRALGARLARNFGTDFVHFSVWGRIDPDLPLTLSNFDIRYGSRVLWGDRETLDRLPRFAAADLPPFEAVQLLFNRLAGMLTALPWPGSPAPAEPDARRYLVNQVMKALMALGDWHLLRHGAYACSYGTRARRLAWLGGLELSAEQRTAIEMAYQYKLRPETVTTAHPVSLGHHAAAWLTEAIIAGVATMTRRPVTSVTEAAEAYYAFTTGDAGLVSADNAFARETLGTRLHAQVLADTSRSVRQTIYASFPRLAAAADGDAVAFASAIRDLQGCFVTPWPRALAPETWDRARRRVSDIWLTLVH